jgi:hypothetical protein
MQSYQDKVLFTAFAAIKWANRYAEGTEAKIKQDLSAEIVQLDESYRQIRSSLSEKEYDAFAVACSIGRL